MKKKILALAVSGGLAAAPMGAMAAPEVYGLIDIGLEQFSADNDAASGNEIFKGFNSVDGNSDDRDFTLSNGMTSRLGVRGSEELDVADLTASYNIELQIDVLNDGGGATNTRLGWAALGGDWGRIKAGSQWQALYEFGGWNTHRTDVHGYGTYYYTTSVLNDSTAYGFRQDSAISYEYGSAWGHSDPFSAQVTLGIGDGSTADGVDSAGDSVTVQNEEGITSVQAAAQYSFNDQVSVNAVVHQEFSSYTDPGGGFSGTTTLDGLNSEPMLVNVGARWNVTEALELAANYTQVDLDDADDNKRDAITIASFMDFGQGLTGHLGLSQGSDDRDEEQLYEGRDIDLNAFGYIKQALSDRTSIRLELEHIQYDGGSNVTNLSGTETYDMDGDATVAMVGLQHNF